MELKICLNCQKEIKPRRSVDYSRMKYCSSECNYYFREKSQKEYKKYKKKNCEECNVTSGLGEDWFNRKLAVHHIDEDPSNNNPDNLLTLCRQCHHKKHRKENSNLSSVVALK